MVKYDVKFLYRVVKVQCSDCPLETSSEVKAAIYHDLTWKLNVHLASRLPFRQHFE